MEQLLSIIINGGKAEAIISILLAIVAALGYISWKVFNSAADERKELLNSFQKQIEVERNELIEILEKYQQGQLSVVQAMNEIKILIATIGARI
jgi:hypothetical protein